MKKLLSFLAIAASLLSASNSGAQGFGASSATPAIRQAIYGLPTTVFVVPGITTTNIPTALAPVFNIGRDGFGITFNTAGTNSTTTTNSTYIFEFSGDGVNFATNNTLTVLSSPLGVQYAPHYTNIVSTVPNVGNAVYARLRSVQNTNIASLFITNLAISTR